MTFNVTSIDWWSVLICAAFVAVLQPLLQSAARQVRRLFGHVDALLERQSPAPASAAPPQWTSIAAQKNPSEPTGDYSHILQIIDAEIAAREAASSALREAEARYRSIFENSVEGIFQTTPDGRYLSANPALARIYGYNSPSELIGSIGNIERQLYVDPDRRHEFARRLTQSDVVTGFESEVYRRDGSVIWISENARAIRDAGDQIVRYEGTVVDITERKQLDDFRRQKETADAANQAKSTFLARMSHEIRTPLNGVIGMLELLRSSPLDGRQQHHVQIARTSADVLLGLINQLLDFSKIEAGKLELESVEFDVQTLVDDVIEMFGHKAQDKGIELTAHVLPEVPRLAQGDPERIRQMLINLVNNALKFTERGEVSIQVSREESGEIRFSVRDTGIGLTPPQKERLFSPFMQADASTTRKYGGTGLGLAICRQLAELMGGCIEVDSEPGSGSTFWFRIPLRAAADSERPRLTVPANLARLRVLAVDDNVTNLTILHDQLTQWTFRPTLLSDPTKVLAELRQGQVEGDPYRLVILDHQMPGMDGEKVARAIRREAGLGRVPLLMLTSADNPLSREIREQAGLAACISKPVRESRLFDTIISTLNPESRRQDRPGASPRHDLTPSPVHRGKLLLAEDNDINQLVAVQILQNAGWDVDVADDGQAAVDAVLRTRYDAVLMDCQMPILDGLEATREIRRLEQDGSLSVQACRPLPIIALTANASTGDRDRCLAAGMGAFVSKPIVVDQLLGVLNDLTAVSAAARIEQPAAAVLSTLPTLSAADESVLQETFEGIPEPVAPAILLDDLLQRCSGNETFARKILEKFRQRMPTSIDAICEAAMNCHHATCGPLAHALKGASASVGAARISAAAAELEQWSKRHDAGNPAWYVAQLREEQRICEEWFAATTSEPNWLTARSAGETSLAATRSFAASSLT
ncbi:PAS domain-containing hybrid sensor histidine kinase/response regulator [Planctomyces sp. SH-PL14]|uniref:PAS domain-containing hybrid sensor histidine kinase/response regulator n=1 Tax=Planctomyces sp. SH-PL14 TaxID=1632864 RepID=UPI00078CB786|nr:response regulator [Planctomyces sp. SH-PL14]AMV18788.1 Signal transduction histidine-protein kinase BarA [Planctomyces sp. SH-PL14]